MVARLVYLDSVTLVVEVPVLSGEAPLSVPLAPGK